MLTLFFFAVLLPSVASAQLNVRAAAIGGWQYDSNIYDVQSGFAVPGTCLAAPYGPIERAHCPAAASHYGDSYYSYAGELDLSETYSQQNWFANLSTTRFVYDYFNQLTHNEYRLDGGWNWKVDDIWDGRLELSRSRSMVAFTELLPNALQLQLAVDTEQRESAQIGVQIMPEWKLEANGFTHKVTEPLFEEPNLQLTESGLGLALNYSGTAGLVSGLAAAYSHGSYTGAIAAISPAYDQKAVGITATYQPSSTSAPALSAASTFDAAVGWSERTSRFGLDDASGVTGHFDYKNQLTGKSSVQVTLDRAINSYLTNGAAEVDTSVGVSALWQATYQISISPGYRWLYSLYPDQGFNPGTDRGDHLQFVSLTVDLQPRPWLDIKPYANIQTRHSNYYGGNFNATVYGVTLTMALQYPHP